MGETPTDESSGLFIAYKDSTTGDTLGNLPSDTPNNALFLRQLSPKDVKWDDRRAEADGFKNLYRGTVFDKYAERIQGCSGRLEFAFQVEDTTGQSKLKLQSAWFCRVRHCPVCQWRRSLVWRAKAFRVLPKVVKDFPNSRFIFLTLTVRNCEVSQLRDTLAWMNKSWERLTKRKEFPAQGFIKAVEVTRGADDTAHPHFHCLLMVTSTYFNGKYYLSQERWTELWKACLKVDYTPIVDVRAVKPKKGKMAAEGSEMSEMLGAVLEVSKYAVKPSDVLSSELDTTRTMSDKDWLVQLTEQLHKMRAIATGGVLKKYLKELEDEPEDLIHVDEDGETSTDENSPRIAFGWKEKIKRYTMESDS